MKLGIVTSTIREGRQSILVANWLKDLAVKRNDGATYEVVDIKDFDLPFFGGNATSDQLKDVEKFGNKMNEFDGFIFVVAEYNHGIPGVFKNALDFLKPQLANKAAAIVGYGGVGGARAIEQLRLILAEMAVATTQRNINFLLAVDFINFSQFAPKEHHLPMIDEMFVQVNNWSKALKTTR